MWTLGSSRPMSRARRLLRRTRKRSREGRLARDGRGTLVVVEDHPSGGHRAESIDQEREAVPRPSQGRRLQGEGGTNFECRRGTWQFSRRPQGWRGGILRRLDGVPVETARQRAWAVRLFVSDERQTD